MWKQFKNRLWCLAHFAEAKDGAALIDHIYMDATPFGTGCCCSQLAFQCANDNDARRMYDALIPVIPIMVCQFRGPAIDESSRSFSHIDGPDCC